MHHVINLSWAEMALRAVRQSVIGLRLEGEHPASRNRIPAAVSLLAPGSGGASPSIRSASVGGRASGEPQPYPCGDVVSNTRLGRSLALHSLRFHSLVAVLGLALAASAFAAEPAGDAQNREKLRAATLRLRDAESELVTAKGERDALAATSKAQEVQLAEMRKNAEGDRLAHVKKAGDLSAKFEESEKERVQLQSELKAERERIAQLQSLAQAREEARLRLVEDKQVVENTLARREVQNIELYSTANEILRRFEKFSLGEAIAAKEPFVGRTRTKLENLIIEYHDKLLAQRAPAKP